MMNLAYEEIIKSLKNEPHKWRYDSCGAETLVHKSGLSIWLDNIPILNTNVYKPAPISLSLLQKYKLYKACREIADYHIVRMVKET